MVSTNISKEELAILVLFIFMAAFVVYGLNGAAGLAFYVCFWLVVTGLYYSEKDKYQEGELFIRVSSYLGFVFIASVLVYLLRMIGIIISFILFVAMLTLVNKKYSTKNKNVKV